MGTKDQHASFDALIRPYLDRLYRLSYRLAGSKDEAEDLFQDVLIKIYPRMDELIDIDEPGSWLCRVLYNHFVDNRRRYQRQRLVVVSEGQLPEGKGLESLPGDLDPGLRAVHLTLQLEPDLAGLGGVEREQLRGELQPPTADRVLGRDHRPEGTIGVPSLRLHGPAEVGRVSWPQGMGSKIRPLRPWRRQ